VIQNWAEYATAAPRLFPRREVRASPASYVSIFPMTGRIRDLRKSLGRSFLKNFEESKSAFLYQEKSKDGQMSRFFKFVHR
jgi:hypothetical protein